MSAENNRHWVRYFVDYAALAAFLAAFLITRDIQKATWGLVAGSVVAIVVGFAVERRIAPLPLFVGGAGLVFGGASLFFHDPRILKVKPTIVNTAIGLLLLGGLVLKKHPLKLVLGDAFDMPEATWRQLTLNYAGLFLSLAALNEFVWRTQTDGTWVFFRFPGMMILTVLFSLAHAPLLMKYVKAEELPPPPTE
ncbi:MAG: septation protein IspZ [Alphaproteobacteria bacterium]|nr:septation protein IspZ [Alphaproteobacteria bacterium]MBU1514870.1 septation protein IspZ [Alphaproteobacteria bacterium]MBU2093791.1 septation protein IspZ [Alphaproteobacteria bacterium]MBU2149412.1 septation protein IspZ [Alphaproteobacteria bacterium]MBU2305372.1 septation protein IspZ [Alphaproteobacteria bacterium]